MSIVKKVSTLTFGRGLNILINFLFLPYMARMLSYEDYGSYGQVLLIVSFALAFLTLGLPQILYVYLSKEGADKNAVFSSNVLSLSILGFLGAIILFALSTLMAAWFENPQISFLLKIYAWALVFQMPFESIVSWLIYNGKVKAVALVSVFSNLLKVALVVTVVQLYESVELVFYSILVTTIAQFGVALYLARRHFVKYIELKATIQQIKDGLPLGLTALFGTGILYIDGIMVSSMLGVESYAIYRNGAIEVPFVSTIYASIAAIILPEVSKLFSKNKLDEIVKLKSRVIMNSMGLIYPILVFLLFNSRDFILVYLGEQYKASAIIFLIFNLTLLIRVNRHSDILIAANKGKIILGVNLFVFILNIGLNYILIEQWGRLGAAMSTVFAIFVLTALLLFYSVKLLNTSIFKLISVKKMTEIFLISLAGVFITELIELGEGNEFYELGVKLFVYSTLVYFYILKRDLIEKKILNKILPL
jgi:O-antigen/teichoic acid export membrane protein